MENKKKRICLALGYVQAEDAITKIIETNYHQKYEIVQNVRSKEALYETINKEKYDVIMLREDLPGNVDLIDIFKVIRTSAFNTQIIFLMNERQNGDPFFIELFLFNVFDFVILPNIKLDEIFGFLEKPRFFRDIVRFMPIRAERVRNLIIEANKDLKAPLKVDEEGDVDEVLDINIGKKASTPEVQVKEVIKYVEKPVIREIIKEVPVPVDMNTFNSSQNSIQNINTENNENSEKQLPEESLTSLSDTIEEPIEDSIEQNNNKDIIDSSNFNTNEIIEDDSEEDDI